MPRWIKAAFAGLTLSFVALAPVMAASYFVPPPGLTLTSGTPTNRLMLRAPKKVHLDPKYMRQVVPFQSDERAGTLIVSTGEKFLYLVLGDGRALRYGIGTARTGFEWSGTHHITRKAEWPGWTPPAEMRQRRPDLPSYMPGGQTNPLGARALYIGATLYRIHGTNEPWTIGGDVSSGCIRMVNDDVIDLYGRVKIGAKVIVL
ncbi:MAG: L,D-transpeptidase [Devosia nanyangense]|uniref:L,D-transpeptidase n=1 Tax=Devosia nanyangense TaxID=1228055 RepID=A0A933KYH5_9HYPH|nr:L,D-transpeptidase [Devosia nanyangense]